MARKRTRVENVGDVMPLALLDPGARVARRAWYESRRLFRWPQQHEAMQEARRAYGLKPDGRRPGDPDPRDLLIGMVNDSPSIPSRRR